MHEGNTPNEPIDVHSVLAIMIEQMAEIAWQKMGLRPDMITNEIVTDYGQAKVAIDTVAYLADQLLPKLEDSDKRQIQNLVTDLRMNYVQKSNGSTT
ncbi:MAG: DUF1844 domain-containing protein [Armatimonadetes bacterium]|nr:DUF1844 domain-containing protein [Armatimonadota bacterium]